MAKERALKEAWDATDLIDKGCCTCGHVPSFEDIVDDFEIWKMSPLEYEYRADCDSHEAIDGNHRGIYLTVPISLLVKSK